MNEAGRLAAKDDVDKVVEAVAAAAAAVSVARKLVLGGAK